jgi:hypothetical protein
MHSRRMKQCLRERSSSPPERTKSSYAKDKGRDPYRKPSGFSPGYRSASPKPSFGFNASRGSSGGNGRLTRDDVKQCNCCGCAHFEDVGYGKCPWRPTDSEGKPKIQGYSGWDLKYYLSKSPRPQRAMYYRMLEIDADHPARMGREDRDSFFCQVNGDQGGT